MPATAASLPPQDPAHHAALSELVRLGLAVARVASHLAEVEDASLHALADAAARTTRALTATPASLDEARRTGQDADALEAARDAATARVASIASAFDQAARAVRRTVALQARLAAGRPFAPLPPAHANISRAPAASRPCNGPNRNAEPRESADRPETGDELSGTPEAHALRVVCCDLARAAPGVPEPPVPAAPAFASTPAPPATHPGHPPVPHRHPTPPQNGDPQTTA